MYSRLFRLSITLHGVLKLVRRTMTSLRVQLPGKFDFSRQGEWPKWSRRFERLRQAYGLAKEEEESQINTLIYAMRTRIRLFFAHHRTLALVRTLGFE